MPLILILEDSPAQLREAVDIAQRAGFTEFEVFQYAGDARAYCEKAMNGQLPFPDAMVVDLDLGIENGFELLRFWHGNPRLKVVPVVVWTVMGDHEREICGLFGVTRYLSKEDGPQVLLDSLSGFLAGSTDAGPPS